MKGCQEDLKHLRLELYLCISMGSTSLSWFCDVLLLSQLHPETISAKEICLRLSGALAREGNSSN